MKKVIFIASTGGHLNELLQLENCFNNYDYTLITEKTKSNINLKNKFPGRVKYLTPGTYTTKKAKIVYPFKFIKNSITSFWYFIRIRPDVIVTTGTHTAVPICYIAHWFRKKVIFIETFANSNSPTKSGKMIYPISSHFIIQWESMKEFYPNAIYGGWIY